MISAFFYILCILKSTSFTIKTFVKPYNDFSLKVSKKDNTYKQFHHEISETAFGSDMRNITEKFVDVYELLNKAHSLAELQKNRVQYLHPLSRKSDSYALNVKNGGLLNEYDSNSYWDDDEFNKLWDFDENYDDYKSRSTNPDEDEF